jgi:mannose-6-phosphate isomerase-like protein (cupin superfamily)
MRRFVIPLLFATVAYAGNPPEPKVVSLSGDGKEVPILTGVPESAGMRSGRILLAPGESVGEHTTGDHEEVLVVLEGRGEIVLNGSRKLPVEANHAVYCPPRTVHNVTNTGTVPLRYVYVVAPVTASN